MYLGEGYYLDSDKYQYILERHAVLKTGKNAGEEVAVDQSFHPTVHAACEYLLRKIQRNELKEYNKKPKDMADSFEKHLEAVRDMFKKAEHLKLEG